MATLRVDDVVVGSDLFLSDIDLDNKRFEFVQASAESLRQSAFHGRIIPTSRRLWTLPIRDALKISAETLTIHTKPIHFLHNTSYCGSTVLSRTLDIADTVCGLREPAALTRLFDIRRTIPDGADELFAKWQHTARFVFFGLTATRPEPVVTLKPPGRFVVLLQELAELLPSSKAVFLYNSLDRHLHSTLKRESRIAAKQRIVSEYAVESVAAALRSPAFLQPVKTDSEAAACAWHWWTDAARRGAVAMPDRVRTVSAEQFFAEPEATYAAISDFLGLGISAETIHQIITHPDYANDAKTDFAFKSLTPLLKRTGLYWKIAPHLPKRRLTERPQYAPVSQAAIDSGIAWVEATGASATAQLPQPLLGVAAS